VIVELDPDAPVGELHEVVNRGTDLLGVWCGQAHHAELHPGQMATFERIPAMVDAPWMKWRLAVLIAAQHVDRAA